MDRKILVEVTEEEYEKIKDGIFEKEPEVITEIREVPTVMDKHFKCGFGRKVSFKSYSGNTKYEGTVVGFILTTRLPNNTETKELTPLYQIEYYDEHFGMKSMAWLEERYVTLIPNDTKENTNESK